MDLFGLDLPHPCYLMANEHFVIGYVEENEGHGDSGILKTFCEFRNLLIGASRDCRGERHQREGHGDKNPSPDRGRFFHD